VIFSTQFVSNWTKYLETFSLKKRKGYIFHSPPKGGGTAEAFQSLFSHIDGRIRDGHGVDAEVDTDPAIALSVI
jgi:hypothetical protein